MAYQYNRSTILDGFSLNPLPYPVLLILGVTFLFLGLQWYVSYESVVEATEDSMGWLLMAAPLLLAVRWISTWENPSWWPFYAATQPWYRRNGGYYYLSSTSEGGSPWGVAALILLLLLVQYQSSFLESWFVSVQK